MIENSSTSSSPMLENIKPDDLEPKVAPPQEKPSPFSIFKPELDLGLKLLHQQCLSKSFVYSPTAICLGLSLFHSGGAVDENLKEKIREALLDGSTEEQFNNHFKKVQKQLPVKPNANELVVAKHVFVSHNPSKEPKSEDISTIDFNNDNYATINDTMSAKTKGVIPKIVEPGSIRQDLTALITTALLFKTALRSDIRFFGTHRKVFYKGPKSKQTIEYWEVENKARMAGNSAFEVYTSNHVLGLNYTLSVITPRKDFNLDKVLNKLDANMIQNLIDSEEEQIVELTIPKFKMISNLGATTAREVLGWDEAGGFENVELAHTVSIGVDRYTPPKGTRLAIPSNHPKFLEDRRKYQKLDSEGNPIGRKFITNQPFIYIITKDNHPIVMGYYNGVV